MDRTGLSIVALLIFLAASPCATMAQCGSRAQEGDYFVYLSDNPTGGELCSRIFDSTPGVRQIYVFVSTSGATAVEFSAPLPECLIGATYLSDTAVFLLTMGNSQTGVSINFGTCLSGSAIHVLTINVMMQGLTEECCHYSVLPHPIPGIPNSILFVGCSSNWIVARSGTTFVLNTPGTKLEDPYPPDGAVKQPLDVRLSWMEHPCDCSNCTPVSIDVYFGTNPDPPLVAQLNTFPYEFPYDPGPLQPSMTYYWKLKSYGTDNPWMSPVWSFTTGTGTPIKTTSWGAIKAIYRE